MHLAFDGGQASSSCPCIVLFRMCAFLGMVLFLLQPARGVVGVLWEDTMELGRRLRNVGLEKRGWIVVWLASV